MRTRSFLGPRDGHAPVVLLVAVLGAAAAIVTGARGAGGPAPASHAASDTVPTFASQVAPILYRNCVSCHRAGGIAPFSLTSYDSARARRRDIAKAVREGHMPPWHADAPPGTFVNERRLADDEKRTILRWVAANAPLGDRRKLPPVPVFTDGWELGTPDTVITMPTAYHVPAEGAIEYQYFEAPTNFAEDRWIEAYEIKPGAREVVHHVLVYVRPPDAPAPTQAGAPATGAAAAPAPRPVLVFDTTINRTPRRDRRDTANAPPRRLGALIASTAPGTNVVRLPEGRALRIRAGSVLTFQMHYTAHGHAEKDQTSIGFRFATAPPTEQVLSTAFYNGQFAIAPGAKDTMIQASLGFNEAVRVYGLLPHTHLRGKRWQYVLEKPDGTSEVVLDVPRYDFNWQSFYLYAKPLEIPAGARLVSRAWYDNSADNEHNPDATVTVRWGDQTWEEMQYTGILYSVPGRRVR